MKDWNSTVETPRSKGTSPSGNSRGSMTTPTRSPGYSTTISSPDSIVFHGGEASLEKLNQSLSDFVQLLGSVGTRTFEARATLQCQGRRNDGIANSGWWVEWEGCQFDQCCQGVGRWQEWFGEGVEFAKQGDYEDVGGWWFDEGVYEVFVKSLVN